MHYISMSLRWLAPWLMVLVLLPSAQAAGPAAPARAIAHVSGGVGEAERQSLQEQQAQYSFWLKTAVKQSGAYVAGVQVRIVDSRNKQLVFEQTLDGPWLLAALAPGPYEIEANWRPDEAAPVQTLRRKTSIRSGAQRQMILHFDAPE